MALIKWNPSEQQFRGSRTGSTFSANKAGEIIRAHRKPLLKMTPAATQSRAIFRHVVQRFRLLTNSQRNTYINRSPLYPFINSLGDVYTLAPWNKFSNTNLKRIPENLTLQLTLPNPATIANRFPASGVMDIDPIDISVSMNNGTVQANRLLKIWASLLSNSIDSLQWPQDYFLIDSFLPGSYPSLNLGTSYSSKVTPGPSLPQPVQKWYYIQIISQYVVTTTGQQSVSSPLVLSIFQ